MIKTLLTSTLFILFSPRSSLALVCNPLIKNCQNIVTNPKAYTNSVIQTMFSLFFVVGFIYFVWHFVMGAYHFMVTEGDPKRYETAKNEITWSLLGIVVLFSVFAVLKLVGYILGIEGLDHLTITLPSL